jgi:hypothetical protein
MSPRGLDVAQPMQLPVKFRSHNLSTALRDRHRIVTCPAALDLLRARRLAPRASELARAQRWPAHDHGAPVQQRQTARRAITDLR